MSIAFIELPTDVVFFLQTLRAYFRLLTPELFLCIRIEGGRAISEGLYEGVSDSSAGRHDPREAALAALDLMKLKIALDYLSKCFAQPPAKKGSM